MLAKVRSCAVIGLEGALVEVEIDLSNGLAGFMIVGLPDTAVNEAKDRVRAAIKNSGCLSPYKRITVNLAPADLRKEGPAYALPIAIGILMALWDPRISDVSAFISVASVTIPTALRCGFSKTLRHLVLMSSSIGVWNPEVSDAIPLFSAHAKEGAKEHFDDTRLRVAV